MEVCGDEKALWEAECGGIWRLTRLEKASGMIGSEFTLLLFFGSREACISVMKICS